MGRKEDIQRLYKKIELLVSVKKRFMCRLQMVSASGLAFEIPPIEAAVEQIDRDILELSREIRYRTEYMI